MDVRKMLLASTWCAVPDRKQRILISLCGKSGESFRFRTGELVAGRKLDLEGLGSGGGFGIEM
jgi:hypothetical protein